MSYTLLIILTFISQYVEPIGCWDGYWGYVAPTNIKCMSYRERGDSGVDALVFDTIEDIIEYYSDTEYNYFFVDGEWYFLPHRVEQLMKVVDALDEII